MFARKRKEQENTGNEAPRWLELEERFKKDKIKRYFLIFVVGTIYTALKFLCYSNFIEEHLKVVFTVGSDALLAVATAFLAELLVNTNYNQQFKHSLYEIITDPNLMGKFVDRERKEEIMYVAMEANLGAHVTNALYNNIFNNNLHVYNKILREDFHFNIHLENSDREDFYFADMQIVFRIPPHEDDFDLQVWACEEHKQMQEKMRGVKKEYRQMVFPLVLADKIGEIKEEPFHVKIIINEKEEELEGGNEKKVTIKKSELSSYVRINIQTFLNKKENFFQEDIFCFYKGYTLTLSYESGLFKRCQCYHSCKSKDLVMIQTNNMITIHMDGILLPENNFVFIWEKDEKNVALSNDGH